MKRIVQLLMLLLAYNIAFSQAGNFDTSFSHNGIVKTQFNHPAVLHALALQADGKIIAVGTVDSFFTLVRYKTNGLTDKSFGDDGIVKGLRGAANAVAIQADGQIVVAGTTSKPHGYETYYNIIVARYNIHGDVDSGFGNNGSVTINIGDIDYCKAVAIQPDGKIVLAGTTAKGHVYAYTKALLIRLNTDGSYDTNFGESGKVIASIDKSGFIIGRSAAIRTIALQNDGKILIGGVGADADGTSDGLHTVLMRFKKNGELDKSFGDNGRANFDGINIYDIAVQSDGKIVCAGSAQEFHYDEHGYWYSDVPDLSRYEKDGAIDTKYGKNGYTGIPPYSDRSAQVYSIALLPNDESVSTMQNLYSYSDTALAVLKYNANGNLDSAFDNDGEKVFRNLYMQRNTRATSPSTPILVQPDGKIVVGCTYNSTGFYIARLLNSEAGNENMYSEPKAVKNTKSKASIYPNPAHDILAIKGLDATTSFKLTITDMQGKMYKSADVKNNSSFTFNIQNLLAGTYMLTIQNAASTETINFIKQ